MAKKGLKTGAFGFNIIYGVFKNMMIVLVVLLSLIGFLGLGTGMGFFAALISEEKPPTEEEMAQAIGNVELVSSMHYNDGNLISEIRTDLHRTMVTGEEISPLIKKGLISTEDEYFYEHNGIVPKAVLRALITEATGIGETTGGSTLTQQLIKQQILSSEVTFSRKANEILLAMRLENYFDKDEILTAYLNVSPFGRNSAGSNVAGIEEAATGIFGVKANEVSLPQAAFLVGLPQNPYGYTPFTVEGERKEDTSEGVERMQAVLYRMYAEEEITKAEYEEAIAYDITQDFITAQESDLNQNNYLYQQVEKQTIEVLMTQEAEKNGLTFEELDANVDLYNEYYFRNQTLLNSSGYKVYSTINKDIYAAMQQAVAEYGGNLGPTFIDTYIHEETGETMEVTELAQSGSIMIENQTGKILGFIGGRDFSIDQNDHAFDAYRSPGSTIKPLAVYGPAIEMNLITPATMLPDSRTGIIQPDGSEWDVSNIGGVISNTLVPARKALYNSMNNPTAKLYYEMLTNGMEPYQFMDKMNYKKIDDTKINPAFSLGSTLTSIEEQTNAFSVFANQGKFIDSYLIEKIEDANGNLVFQHESEPVEVFSPQAAYLTLDILRDVINLGFSNQVNGYLNFSADFAAKTGTTEFNEDYWFIGSTPTVTLSSWVGYNNAIEKHTFYDPNSTGAPSSNNMRYWSLIANKINEVDPEVFGTELTHAKPEGIVEAQFVAETGTLPGKVAIPGTSITANIDGSKNTEIFKSDNLPKAITYDFVPGANQNDLKNLFWDKFEKKAKEEQAKKEAEEKRKQEDAKKKQEDTQKQEAEKAKADAEKKKQEEEKKKEEAEKEKDDD
ncbi:penicillin-binding protein [Jeotgalibaca sp. MA1X17-3]|uniref:transglycosylase domain-containing protein n=1 Tax=Jeotgalibaca sp. MA1X17-3 TaxID=2908211 RepID=UPI001F1D2666|nr:transglycosylase domain-containing protein [Jeotgalibaca sp. MA1X17-3]UJF14655.1 penicillin-binding protein [Jeotgalibaca sp. MA1X17-3]